MSGDDFEVLLKNLIGLDPASIGSHAIARAVRQRMNALKLDDRNRYLAVLGTHTEERQALIELVVVPETWFFRYAESFTVLNDLARERRTALGTTRPLRLLSLPCSTGEEPYSIAMSLLSAGFISHQFTIDAMDVSPLSLQQAQVARYGRNAFRGQDLAYRQRFFTEVDTGVYEIRSEVQACVRFMRGNILDPLLLQSEPPYDFVFCRNLLIYFDVPTQLAALQTLQRLACAAHGVLFIGPAEASLMSAQGLASLGRTMSFAFRATPHQSLPVVLPPMPVRTATLPVPPPRPAVAKMPFSNGPAKSPGFASSVLSDGHNADRASASKPSAKPAQAATIFSHIQHLADTGKLDEAWQCCQKELQQQGPNTELFYWLGLLSDARGQSRLARDYYRKVLYLQPGHDQALAHLASLLLKEGDIDGAERLHARARRGVNGHV